MSEGRGFGGGLIDLCFSRLAAGGFGGVVVVVVGRFGRLIDLIDRRARTINPSEHRRRPSDRRGTAAPADA